MAQPTIKIPSNRGLLIFSVFCGRNFSRLIFLNFYFSYLSIHISYKHKHVPSLWWAPQPGTASLLNFAFLTEPLRLRFFLTLSLLCLTVLVLGALLSSFLEEALYKCSI